MKKTVKKLLALSMAAVMAAGLAGCSGSAETTTAADSKAETQAEAKTEAQAGGGESQAGGAYTVTDPVEITFATQDVGHMYMRPPWPIFFQMHFQAVPS